MATSDTNLSDPGLRGKNILLGISGGIAAYKAPHLVRLLRQCGAEVQVVMTRGAHHFVTATSLQAVSGKPVRDDPLQLLDPFLETGKPIPFLLERNGARVKATVQPNPK